MGIKKRPKKSHARKPNQRKRPIKGQKSLRGKPELYDELKQRYSFSLTPTLVSIIDGFAEQTNLSRSEYIEQHFRKIIKESRDP